MSAQVEYFGIRHHGPGSARCLESALDELRPRAVLIEGPSDASELLPLLSDAEMKPPFALLAYEEGDASNAVFWPFAEFSPEYRAALWALRNDAILKLIDLPAATKLAVYKAQRAEWLAAHSPDPGAAVETDNASDPPDVSPPSAEDDLLPAASHITIDAPSIDDDPIGALAIAAGYEDGESWWSDVIEENREGGPIFQSIADAMTTLRESTGDREPLNAPREAMMRLKISEIASETDGPIAVVCGAWHVPALRKSPSAKEDRAALKSLGNVKAAITWVPWTTPRLALTSGYGAGVRAPGWYAHLWECRGKRDFDIAWLVRIASLLREGGHLVSTASLIEATRLAAALSSMRGKPAAGFQELRDAAISCLCFGERILWDTVSTNLLVGSGVGEVSSRAPLSPLIADLKLQQKRAALKPEALQRELAVDLRSEIGLAKSTLLHRLTILGVSWGRLLDSGRSRGTFREKWMLQWEPEFAVNLVEHIVHGATIEQAAGQVSMDAMRDSTSLAPLAELVRAAMNAQLESAVTEGVRLLGERAAQTSDCYELLTTISPMAEISRYGHARRGVAASLDALLRQTALEAFIALPYAVRDLDAEAAQRMSDAIGQTHHAIHLAEFSPDDLHSWHRALESVLHGSASTPRVAGVAARLLYDSAVLPAAEAALILGRKLSPGVATTDAAGFFEGFLSGIAAKLIHDRELLQAVDIWLNSLSDESLVENLPLFRRVFGELDRTERARLLGAVVRPQTSHDSRFMPAPNETGWDEHMTAILELMEKGMPR
jgi:hypothetical protein